MLFRIRHDIVRGDGDGLEHVDALLRLRGIDPEARLIRSPRPRRFKRGHLTRAVLRALRDGPQTTAQIAAKVGNHSGTLDSVTGILRRLQQRGQVQVVVKQCGRIKQVWDLA